MPRKTDSDNPADWLWIVQHDLEGMRELLANEVGYGMCRSKLAEALEKIMKAELIRQGWFLEKTHDLQRLRKELNARDPQLGSEIASLCSNLAEAYFRDRYPGYDFPDADWPKLRTELDAVTALFDTISARVRGAQP